VAAAEIERFLMQSPFHVLSRNVLAHMLGMMCEILVHVTHFDGRSPVVFDFRPPDARRTDDPDLVFSSAWQPCPAWGPHGRPLYHLGPPAPAPIHAPAAHDDGAAEVPDGGEQPPPHSADDVFADGAADGAARAHGAPERDASAAPAA